jgi:hypothetical protein
LIANASAPKPSFPSCDTFLIIGRERLVSLHAGLEVLNLSHEFLGVLLVSKAAASKCISRVLQLIEPLKQIARASF